MTTTESCLLLMRLASRSQRFIIMPALPLIYFVLLSTNGMNLPHRGASRFFFSTPLPIEHSVCAAACAPTRPVPRMHTHARCRSSRLRRYRSWCGHTPRWGILPRSSWNAW